MITIGYYTDFILRIKTPVLRSKAVEIADCINSLMGAKALHLCFIDEIDDSKEVDWNFDLGELKWYSWENDMTAIAKKYPDIEFYLEGNGENRDDWWIALFKGDKKQITYCSPPLASWKD